jgi:putative transcriptional regulator
MNRIKEVLEKKGVKQTWLAEKLGKSYAIVNGYAQNRKQPRLEVLYEISKILQVNMKELISESYLQDVGTDIHNKKIN